MANERMERMVQCCISLLILLFCFHVGCKTSSRVVEEAQDLSGCADCIRRVPSVKKLEIVEVSERGEHEEPVEEDPGQMEEGDEDEHQTNEIEEVIDLDHPEDDYQEVYARHENSDIGYSGVLKWHVVEYQEAITRGIRETTFRNREVTAAHCHFSAAPNKDTPIFAMLVRHTGERGDSFYLGREGMAISRVNTAPLARGKTGRVHLVKSAMYCVYREDQNEVGALIFQFSEGSQRREEGPYALVRVEASAERRETGRMMTVQDAQQDTRVVPASEVQVPVYEYVPAQSRVIGVFPTLAEALVAGEEVIPRGRFHLRAENMYPFMKWQSYFGVEEPEFCPAGVECRE